MRKKKDKTGGYSMEVRVLNVLVQWTILDRERCRMQEG